MTNLCGVSHGLMAKVELEEVFSEVTDIAERKLHLRTHLGRTPKVSHSSRRVLSMGLLVALISFQPRLDFSLKTLRNIMRVESSMAGRWMYSL